MHAWGQPQVFLSRCLLVFLRQGLSLRLGSPTGKYQMVSEPQGSLWFWLPSTGILRMTLSSLATWALRINLKSSCLLLADTHFSQCCFHLLKINRSSVLEIWALSKMYKAPTQLVFIFRGILSMSWSQADAELLLSSAKDNRIFCWNLASSEVGRSFYGHAVMEMWQ